jgi:hypothetical protein
MTQRDKVIRLCDNALTTAVVLEKGAVLIEQFEQQAVYFRDLAQLNEFVQKIHEAYKELAQEAHGGPR